MLVSTVSAQLYVAGVKVDTSRSYDIESPCITRGTVSYDADTKTLSLNGVTIDMSKKTFTAAEQNDGYDIPIFNCRLAGETQLNTISTNGFCYIHGAKKNAIVAHYPLTISSSTDGMQYFELKDNFGGIFVVKSLTVKNVNLTVETTATAWCNFNPLQLDPTQSQQDLIVENAGVYLKRPQEVEKMASTGYDGKARAISFPKKLNIQLKGSVFINCTYEGYGHEILGAYLGTATDEPAYWVKIGRPTIDLKLGTTAVTVNNYNDILGDGTASYDFATSTLSLKNATIEGGLRQRGTGSFKLSLEGKNHIKGVTNDNDNNLSTDNYCISFETNKLRIIPAKGQRGKASLEVGQDKSFHHGFVSLTADATIEVDGVDLLLKEVCWPFVYNPLGTSGASTPTTNASEGLTKLQLKDTNFSIEEFGSVYAHLSKVTTEECSFSYSGFDADTHRFKELDRVVVLREDLYPMKVAGLEFKNGTTYSLKTEFPDLDFDDNATISYDSGRLLLINAGDLRQIDGKGRIAYTGVQSLGINMFSSDEAKPTICGSISSKTNVAIVKTTAKSTAEKYNATAEVSMEIHQTEGQSGAIVVPDGNYVLIWGIKQLTIDGPLVNTSFLGKKSDSNVSPIFCVENSHVTMQADNPNYGLLWGFGGVILSGCDILTPGVSESNGNFVTTETNSNTGKTNLTPATYCEIGPATDYGIWVGHVNVTELNASNITGKYIQGKVSFDPETYTLTLEDAQLRGSGNIYDHNFPLIFRPSDEHPNLTVNLVGVNSINGTYGILVDDRNYSGESSVTITGSGKLDVDAVFYGFTAWSEETSKFTLNFDKAHVDVAYGSVDVAYGSAGISLEEANTVVNVKDSYLKFAGKKKAFDVKNLTLNLSGCQIMESTVSLENSALIDSSTGKDAATVTFDSNYNLKVGDVWVTNGNKDAVAGEKVKGQVSYDPETYTLTLRNAYIEGEQLSEGMVNCAIYNSGSREKPLNIDLIGENTITGDMANLQAIFVNGADLNIKGSGTLNILQGHAGIAASDQLTIEDCTLNLNTNYGILLDSNEQAVVFRKANVRTTGYNRLFNAPTFDGCELITPRETFHYDDDGEIANDHDKIQGLTIATTGLWVAGIEVTSANENDVLGDGTVSFDSSKNILTLDNTNIKVEAKNNDCPAAIRFVAPSGVDQLRIALKGANTVEHDKGPAMEILGCGFNIVSVWDTDTQVYTQGNLTLKGGKGAFVSDHDSWDGSFSAPITAISEEGPAIMMPGHLQLYSSLYAVTNDTTNTRPVIEVGGVEKNGLAILEPEEGNVDSDAGGVVRNSYGQVETRQVRIGSNVDYGIVVAGTPITESNASGVSTPMIKEGSITYDAATNTLTLRDAFIDSSVSDLSNIWHERISAYREYAEAKGLSSEERQSGENHLQELYKKAMENVSIGIKVDQNGITDTPLTIALEGESTIQSWNGTGLKLLSPVNMKSAKDDFSGILHIQEYTLNGIELGQKLTLGDVNLELSAVNFGITSADDATATATPKLMVTENAMMHVTGHEASVKGVLISANEEDMMLPKNGSIAADGQTQSIYETTDGTTDYAKEVLFRCPNNYGLFVAGKRVSKDNAADVLGDGKVSFDYDTNTLSLNEAKIATKQGLSQPQDAINYMASRPLNIKLSGVNYLYLNMIDDGYSGVHYIYNSYFGYGIRISTDARLTIQGESSAKDVLAIKYTTDGQQNPSYTYSTTNPGYYATGIWCNDLEIDSCHVFANTNHGIIGRGKFTADNAKVVAYSGLAGVSDPNTIGGFSELELKNCYIDSPDYGYYGWSNYTSRAYTQYRTIVDGKGEELRTKTSGDGYSLYAQISPNQYYSCMNYGVRIYGRELTSDNRSLVLGQNDSSYEKNYVYASEESGSDGQISHIMVRLSNMNIGEDLFNDYPAIEVYDAKYPVVFEVEGDCHMLADGNYGIRLVNGADVTIKPHADGGTLTVEGKVYDGIYVDGGSSLTLEGGSYVNGDGVQNAIGTGWWAPEGTKNTITVDEASAHFFSELASGYLAYNPYVELRIKNSYVAETNATSLTVGDEELITTDTQGKQSVRRKVAGNTKEGLVVKAEGATFMKILPGHAVAETPYISFADINTEQICLEAFDKNGDGVVSMREAAAVTALPEGLFTGQTGVATFDELQYFTALTTLPDEAFAGCTSLRSITLPAALTTIGSQAFAQCESLEAITIPASVTAIGSQALSDAALKTVYMNAGVMELNDVFGDRTDNAEFRVLVDFRMHLGYRQNATKWSSIATQLFPYRSVIDEGAPTDGFDLNEDGNVNVTDALKVVDGRLSTAKP